MNIFSQNMIYHDFIYVTELEMYRRALKIIYINDAEYISSSVKLLSLSNLSAISGYVRASLPETPCPVVQSQYLAPTGITSRAEYSGLKRGLNKMSDVLPPFSSVLPSMKQLVFWFIFHWSAELIYWKLIISQVCFLYEFLWCYLLSKLFCQKKK